MPRNAGAKRAISRSGKRSKRRRSGRRHASRRDSDVLYHRRLDPNDAGRSDVILRVESQKTRLGAPETLCCRRRPAAAERALSSNEAVDRIQSEIAKLPEMQRLVLTLRDVDGLSSEEVCNALDISETNQRVLLHRARAKVRAALEDYYTNA
jgi:RNA polymerase sigma factor (sigma-70 family)